MKIVYQNLKAGDVKVEVESPEDLWYLSQIIEPGDSVKGVTLRKVKATEEAKGERRRVFLAVDAEKLDFTESSLRVTGKITDGPEDVPRGSYHTFNIEPGDTVSIIKDKWFGFQLDRLKEAEVERARILICVFDREEALFALIQRAGYSVLSRLKGSVPKKDYSESVSGNFFAEIVKQLKEYDGRYGLDHIVVASPAFWKDELMKVLKDPSLKRKVTMATCSSVSQSAVDEVLKREEIHSALKQDRVAREVNFVERLMAEISRDGKAVYGLENCEDAAQAGAVDTLLITDSLIRRLREDNEFFRCDQLMRSVDDQRGTVVMVSSSNSAGQKLDGIGGVGAILRYKLSYE